MAAPAQHCLSCGALLRGVVFNQRFRIESLLGQGGMGAVYRATDLTLDRTVALKTLAPSIGTDGGLPAERQARFFREARLAAQLDHPNIVPVLHFDRDEAWLYLVMPRLSGGTLASHLSQRGPIDLLTALVWLRQIAAALDYAHQRPQPIIHRDVKPSNLLFHADGRLCLANFGIARSDSEQGAHDLTQTGVVLGSLAYMAPEQISGHAISASDQYSTGILLYELLTGALPFASSDPYALLLQQVTTVPTSPSQQIPSLPPTVDAVVLRALAKEPAARFPSLGALADALEVALTGTRTASFQGTAVPHLSLPVAPARGRLPADPRGDWPTEAATRWRHSAAGLPAESHPPHSTRPPRRVSIILSAVLPLGCCSVCWCWRLWVPGGRRPPPASRLTPAPSPPPRPHPRPARWPRAIPSQALRAAEPLPPLLADALVDHDHQPGWDVQPPAHFDGHGLHLPPHPPGNQQDGSGLVYTTAQLPQNLPARCEIEVDLRFSGPDALYGFSLLASPSSGEDLQLTSTGSYSVSLVSPGWKHQRPWRRGRIRV